MGRKSESEVEKECGDMLQALYSAKNDEAMAVLGVKMLLLVGDAEKVLGCSRIIRYRFEVALGPCRVDMVLFHKDGGISLVEIKADSDIRTVASGIGQLFVYEAEFPLSKFGKHISPKYVNKILASPTPPERAYKVMRACHLAGVHYACLASHGDVKEAFKKVFGV